MSGGQDAEVEVFEPDLARLLGLVGAAGGSSDETARDRLRGLAGTIVRWNKAINLVSRKDIGRLMAYHFCDSASVLPLLGRRLADGHREAGGQSGLEVLDVGGSNGLPGMVLAAVVPAMRLTVCDSCRKRLGFLGEVCRLGNVPLPQQEIDAGDAGDGGGGAQPGAVPPIVSNATFELGRVESPEFQARHKASFDLIVARAVTGLKLLAKWCLPLLKPGGRLVAYKGSHGAEELAEAQAYLFEHGAGLAAVTASPWGASCNPLRIFTIVDKF